MVDLLAEDPGQPPTLTELEEARADAAMARQRSVKWLMASQETPDFEVLLAELVCRPAWHRQAACWGADPQSVLPRAR